MVTCKVLDDWNKSKPVCSNCKPQLVRHPPPWSAARRQLAHGLVIDNGSRFRLVKPCEARAHRGVHKRQEQARACKSVTLCDALLPQSSTSALPFGLAFRSEPVLRDGDDQGQVGSGDWGVAGRCASITKCCLRYSLQIQGYLGQQIKSATPCDAPLRAEVFWNLCKYAAGVSNSLPRYRWEPLDLAGVLDCRNRSACERALCTRAD